MSKYKYFPSSKLIVELKTYLFLFERKFRNKTNLLKKKNKTIKNQNNVKLQRNEIMSAQLLQTLHANYQAAFNKPVAMRMKNNVRWIRARLAEHENEKLTRLLQK